MRFLTHWLEQYSPSESLDFYRELAISHAWEGGAVGEQIAELIRRDKLKDLCEFEVDYQQIYSEAETHVFLESVASESLSVDGKDYADRVNRRAAALVRSVRQALAFFQKVEDLDIGVDKEKVAMQKFLEAEELCKETNDIFRKARRGEFSFRPRVAAAISSAQRKISRVLGDVPPLGDLSLRFGPGATRATRRSEASIRRKIAEKPQCSKELVPAVSYVLEELPHVTALNELSTREDADGNEWARVELEVIPAKLSFVPKTAKTYRSICTEPGLNVIVQAGIGSVMAKRLLAVGVDIRDQTRNQRLAASGSLTGALATLDLSSASDTISREIVFELLPLDWAIYLARARTQEVLLPNGAVLSQEKFSSMGNGFTFPLETLIFWGLAAACCRSDSDVSVYGDDIIVPTEHFEYLTEVLVACGFVVNTKKSYASGPFRESCGKDYIMGIDVRPYYPRGWMSTQSLFVLHNFYVRRGDTDRAQRVRNRIHPSLVLYGPDGYGDGHLLGDHPKRKLRRYDNRGFGGYFFDTYVTGNPRDKVPLQKGEYVVPLYSIYRRSSDEYFPSNSSFGRDVGSWAFWAKFRHRALGNSGPAPLSLPEGSDDVKHLPLPGVTGYKKIQIYTLRD